MSAPTQQALLMGGLWTPSLFGAGLVVWYKTDTLNGSTGDPQSSLPDYSGNGFSLSQTGTNRPTLQAAGLNSLNTLRFTSANSQYYGLTNSWFSSLTAASCYIVYKAVSGDANLITDLGSSGNHSNYPWIDNNFYVDFGSTTRKTVGAASNSVGIYKTLSMYSASNDWAFYVDGGHGGSSGGTSALFSTATNTVGWNAAAIYLGLGLGAGYFNGWLAEFIITNAKQSTADRQKVEGYLAWKWGLVGNLDTTHPYKLAPP